MSLRLILVIIGVVIVALVYYVSAVKRRRETRMSFDRRFSRFNIPDVILDHHEESATAELEEDEEPVAEQDFLTSQARSSEGEGENERSGKVRDTQPRRAPLPREFVLPAEDGALEELPRVRNDAFIDDEADNRRRSSDQLDLFGAAGEPGKKQAPPTRESTTTAPDGGLITLFVRAKDGKQFAGSDVVRALNAVGMRHGDMAIFHHFGAGELRSASAIFSAANMFEPGTFDLARIEAFRTSGLVLFMQMPAPLEGAVAFELLLNSAQRLTELLGGELFATPREPLDSRNVARLRQRAAPYPRSDGGA